MKIRINKAGKTLQVLGKEENKRGQRLEDGQGEEVDVGKCGVMSLMCPVIGVPVQ